MVAVSAAPRVVRVPSDKSLSHRALIFAALATGESRIHHILNSADIRSTATVLRTLGVEVPPLGDEVVVRGVGLHGWRAPSASLDCGNSGTTTRLMAGAVASAAFTSTFIGDASLSRRPMRRIAAPLSAMGAEVTLSGTEHLPMHIRGGTLHPLEWENATSSAQVKSAILLAGLTAGVNVRIAAPRRSRDHTENFLRALGAELHQSGDGLTVTLAPPTALRPFDVTVPGDPSSAAFVAALALLTPKGAVEIADVLESPDRDGCFRAFERMGARVTRQGTAVNSIGERTTHYLVAASDAPLRGITLGADDIPAMIDEVPLLACVAARAALGQETVITGASELRAKESDRITTTVTNLQRIGVQAEELTDGMRVIGGGDRPLRGNVTTHGDHRIAMSFGILGALSGNGITIDDPACVDVSFPGFWDMLRSLPSARM